MIRHIERIIASGFDYSKTTTMRAVYVENHFQQFKINRSDFASIIQVIHSYLRRTMVTYFHEDIR